MKKKNNIKMVKKGEKKKEDKQKKKIGDRHIALGILLLLIVGVVAAVYINEKKGGISIFGKDNSQTNEGQTSNVQTENTALPPETTSPSPQTNTQQSPPVQTPPPVTTPPVTQTNTPVVCPSPSLSAQEDAKIRNTILSSDLVKALPKDGVISLGFFTFCNGERIVQNTYLIGKAQILTSGTPDIYLTLHSKYIAQLDGNNLCTVIPSAKANGDLGVYSDLSDTKLLMKYSGLLKYRDCLGF